MFIIKDFLHWLSRYRFRFLVLLAAAVWGVVWVWPDSKLSLVFCSVGQGDASIVSRGFTQVLIDAGPASSKAADCLERHLPFFDRRLEAVVVSHAQVDHFGGLAEVLDRYQVDKFIFNGFAGESKAWGEVSRLVEAEESLVIVLAAGDKIRIGEVGIDVLWPKMESKGLTFAQQRIGLKTQNVLGVSSSRDLNADGLVLGLSYGDFSAIFTGDIGRSQESSIIHRLSSIVPVAVLKVPHHGSKTSSSAEFLRAAMPKLAVIEVGKNSYGHPAVEVIERLEEVGARVLRTDKDGDVVVETDGKEWKVSSGF